MNIMVKHLTLTGFEYEYWMQRTAVVARQADPDFSGSATSSTLVIPASANTTVAKRDARLLNCYLINASGEYVVSQAYVLKGNVLSFTPLNR
jgi:hypothetical protein